MSPKVSLIVPIYNASLYLEKCIVSVLSQSFDDIEYIFIDDCSTDNSLEILRRTVSQFPNKTKQIKILVHPTNKGISATRNEAVSLATGDYIASVDSDDYIDPQMIEVLYQTSQQNQSDIVITDYYIEYPEKTIIHSEYYPANNFSCFESFIKEDQFTMCLWNKLIKKELYDRPECKSPEGLNYMDDKYVAAKLFYYSNKVSKAKGVFYHYCKLNPLSITAHRTRKQFEDIVWFWTIFDEFLKEQNIYNQYLKHVSKQKIKSKVSLLIGCNSMAIRKDFASIFIEVEKETLQYFKSGERLMLFLVRNRLFLMSQLLHKAYIWKQHFNSAFK